MGHYTLYLRVDYILKEPYKSITCDLFNWMKYIPHNGESNCISGSLKTCSGIYESIVAVREKTSDDTGFFR
jgi:hypothetical protein